MMSNPFVCCFLMACFVRLSNAIVCYDCRSDDSTCNMGECHGMSCLKMETSNMDNERKTVIKSCNNNMEIAQCKQSGFGSKLITRCTCNTDFCNGDEVLSASGLIFSSSPRLMPSFSTFSFIYLFVFCFLIDRFENLFL